MQAVVARRDHGADDLINEIREAATTRHTRLLAEPPTDGEAPAPGLFGAIGWSTALLLRNRPLDVWMHEQDVRRAIGTPGNLDSVGARHVVDYLSESLGLVLAKRVGAEPGTTLVLAVDDYPPRAFEVGEDGRGRPLADVPEQPTVTLTMEAESFVLLAGGRRAPAPDAVGVTGDAELGRAVLERMAVTP